MQLPRPTAHGLELIASVVKEFLARLGPGLASNERPAIFAVDFLWGELAAGQAGDGREQVDRAEQLGAGSAGGNLSRPAHDARHANAAFESRKLAFAKRPGGAGVIAVG